MVISAKFLLVMLMAFCTVLSILIIHQACVPYFNLYSAIHPLVDRSNEYPSTKKQTDLTNRKVNPLNHTVKNGLRIDTFNLQRKFHHVKEMNQNFEIRMSELKPFEIQITVKEREMMYTLIEVFDKIMKKHNVQYFMYGGMLLGSYRHHDLIPWDDDLDVFVSERYYYKIEEIINTFLPEFIIYRENGFHKFYHKSGIKNSRYNWLWPNVDIFYYEDNGAFINDLTVTNNKLYSFPKEIVFPLHNRPFFNLSLPAPRDTFAFLTWTYNYGSSCSIHGYSHMAKQYKTSVTTDCQLLADKYPFVEHFPNVKGVREILRYKDMVIADIILPEPHYAVSETFHLSLQSGYEMPRHIIPPE